MIGIEYDFSCDTEHQRCPHRRAPWASYNFGIAASMVVMAKTDQYDDLDHEGLLSDEAPTDVY
jgi:hypothetical protein